MKSKKSDLMNTKNLHDSQFMSPNLLDGLNGYHNAKYQDSPANAEIERLVAKIDTLRNGKAQQTIMVTSSLQGEGKSTVATRIAQTMARKRGKTLLVDFDLRRPRQHRIFDVIRGDGVVDILNFGLSVQRCLKETSVPKLFLVTSGIVKENPIELLNMDKVQKLLNEARENFDYVVLDAPPIIPVSDPLLLGKLVDNVILVIKAGETSRNIIKRAVDMFYDVKVDISGVVLNNMKNVLPYYYDHDYYGYKYFATDQDLLLD